MKKLLLLIAILFSLTAKAQTGQKYKSNKWAGSYSFGTSADKGATGYLILFPESDTTMLFHIEVNRGKPSYNSGESYGRIYFNADSAYYSFTDTSHYLDCGLKFILKEESVEIKYLGWNQSRDECGYGFHVYANGKYIKKDNKLYKSFITREEKEIIFSPETLNEWEKR